ncbi:hypothetical protein BJ742DRAFT_182276 [Cladochytrium replicatum]|nr:hypothetical protein BJ742DRAFT_182276 [Cladochytrium replicatum]
MLFNNPAALEFRPTTPRTPAAQRQIARTPGTTPRPASQHKSGHRFSSSTGWTNMQALITDTQGILTVADVFSNPCDSKISRMIVMIVEIKHSDVLSDAGAVFNDPTGEMPGTIHSSVFERFAEALNPGSVLELQQISVFKPSARSRYLNVTIGNVRSVFPAGGVPVRVLRDEEQPS